MSSDERFVTGRPERARVRLDESPMPEISAVVDFPRRTGARDSALLFIGIWFGVAVTLLILGLTGAIK